MLYAVCCCCAIIALKNLLSWIIDDNHIDLRYLLAHKGILLLADRLKLSFELQFSVPQV